MQRIAAFNLSILAMFVLGNCCVPAGIVRVSSDYRGFVFDATTRQPIAGVSVLLERHGARVVTDATGEFHLRPQYGTKWSCIHLPNISGGSGGPDWSSYADISITANGYNKAKIRSGSEQGGETLTYLTVPDGFNDQLTSSDLSSMGMREFKRRGSVWQRSHPEHTERRFVCLVYLHKHGLETPKN
jgi:hypothetical protein